MNAVIMAGGQGTRLMPLTANIPKPMAEIAGKPCILRTVELLRKYGVNDIAVTLAYKKDLIKEALREEHVRFYEEDKPLGTAGSVKNCAGFVDEDFMVISGDAVCDFDLAKIISAHMAHGDPVTVVLTESDEPLEYGVCVLDDSGVITRFIEKPSWECVYSNLINTGIYVLSKRVLEYIPSDRPFDFSKDLFPLLMSKGVKIHGFAADGYWCDIGNIKAYMQCNKDILCGAADIEYTTGQCAGADIRPPCVIGKNVRAEGAVIGPYSVIGDGCVIGEGSVIEGSILGKGSILGDECRVQNALLCGSVKAGAGVKIYDYAVISDNCTLGENSTVSCESLVYPDSIIEAGAMVKQNVMRGMRKTLFEHGHISSPENISEYSQWGYAFGKAFEGNIGVASEDGTCLSESMGVMCGVMGSGRGVMNMGECDINVFRYTVKAYGFGGGIFVTDKRLYFFEEDGLPLSRFSERKVFRAFFDPQPFRSGSGGKYRILNHYLNVYVQKLKRYLINSPALKFQVVAPSFVTELMNIRGSEKDETVYMSDALSVSGYTDEQVKCAVCYAYGKTYGKVYIPYDFPQIAESMGRTEGFEVVRLSFDDADRRYLYDMTDINVMGCVLLRYLAKKKMTFSDLIAKLPEIYVCRAEVDADRCSVMRSLSAMENCSSRSEGVSFCDDEKKNYVTVVPRRDANGFRLVAESMNSETAGELCDFYVRKIKSICREVDK